MEKSTSFSKTERSGQQRNRMRGHTEMKAEVVAMDAEHLDMEAIQKAGKILKEGGLVAFPTETVYGLGGNALDPKASMKIYAAKGRPSDNPLIVHIADIDDLAKITTEIPKGARILAEKYWPGPLTMILPKADIVPKETTGGLDSVAVRFPSDRIAQELIKAAGGFVAAPSANTSGRPSPTMAEHVEEDLGDAIEMIIDGGPVGIGVESTIVDVSGDVPAVLRPGAITMEMLKDVLGEVTIDPAILGPMAAGVRPKAPGMKYKHYAPKADLTLVEPANVADARKTGEAVAMTQEQVNAMVETVWKLAKEKIDAGYKVGIICTDESRSHYPEGEVRSIGARKSQASVAHNLYALLREFDDLKVDYIYSESFSQDHLGQAIMNRLSKAAGYQIYKV